MAEEWDEQWNDDDWLKTQPLNSLQAILEKAGDNAKKTRIQLAITNRLNSLDTLAHENKLTSEHSYEALEYVSALKDDDIKNSFDDAETLGYIIETRKRALKPETSFEAAAEYRALLTIEHRISGALGGDVSSIERELDDNEQKIIARLNTVAAQDEITDAQDAAFDKLFDDNSSIHPLTDTEALTKAKDAFLDKLAKMSGWDGTSKPEIEQGDTRLNSALNNLTLEPYNSNGLNPLYDQCKDLLNKIQFSFADNVSPENQAELAQSLKSQLLSNASMRAATELLRRPDRLDANHPENHLKIYKEEIARQLQSSFITAGLLSQRDTGDTSFGLRRNAEGKIEYTGEPDAAIAEVLDGKIKLNPFTVQMDTEQLRHEEKRLEKIWKHKKVDPNKLSFKQKVKKTWTAVCKNVSENIIKNGGWKKLAANFVVNGVTSYFMMSGAGLAVVGTAAAAYAAWGFVNNRIIPVWELKKKEKISFKEAWKKKWADKEQKNRSKWRVAESIGTAGLVTGLAAIGVSPIVQKWGRKALMLTSKGIAFWRSKSFKKEAEMINNANYTIKNTTKLHAAQQYAKQDAFGLAGVGLGAAASILGELHSETQTNTQAASGSQEQVSQKPAATAASQPQTHSSAAPQSTAVKTGEMQTGVKSSETRVTPPRRPAAHTGSGTHSQPGSTGGSTNLKGSTNLDDNKTSLDGDKLDKIAQQWVSTQAPLTTEDPVASVEVPDYPNAPKSFVTKLSDEHILAAKELRVQRMQTLENGNISVERISDGGRKFTAVVSPEGKFISASVALKDGTMRPLTPEQCSAISTLPQYIDENKKLFEIAQGSKNETMDFTGEQPVVHSLDPAKEVLENIVRARQAAGNTDGTTMLASDGKPGEVQAGDGKPGEVQSGEGKPGDTPARQINIDDPTISQTLTSNQDILNKHGLDGNVSLVQDMSSIIDRNGTISGTINIVCKSDNGLMSFYQNGENLATSSVVIGENNEVQFKIGINGNISNVPASEAGYNAAQRICREFWGCSDQRLKFDDLAGLRNMDNISIDVLRNENFVSDTSLMMLKKLQVLSPESFNRDYGENLGRIVSEYTAPADYNITDNVKSFDANSFPTPGRLGRHIDALRGTRPSSFSSGGRPVASTQRATGHAMPISPPSRSYS